jgi:hypothetical protein
MNNEGDYEVRLQQYPTNLTPLNDPQNRARNPEPAFSWGDRFQLVQLCTSHPPFSLVIPVKKIYGFSLI